MSWNNIIPASILQEIADSMPKQHDLDLACAPVYTIKEEYLTSCNVAYSYVNPDGQERGTHSHVDHPSFAALRAHLAAIGLIEIPNYPCVNGDRVLKPFYLNGVYFRPDQKFFSASAMGAHIHFMKKQLT